MLERYQKSPWELTQVARQRLPQRFAGFEAWAVVPDSSFAHSTALTAGFGRMFAGPSTPLRKSAAGSNAR